MNYLTPLLLIAALWGSAVHAQEAEMLVPDGWTSTGEGISKGNNELLLGPVLDLGELSSADYLKKLAEVPTDGIEIISIGELKESEQLVQLTRQVKSNDTKARSTLFICKTGLNKHRLLGLYTEDVFALLAGGRSAIQFCHQQ